MLMGLVVAGFFESEFRVGVLQFLLRNEVRLYTFPDLLLILFIVLKKMVWPPVQ